MENDEIKDTEELTEEEEKELSRETSFHPGEVSYRSIVDEMKSNYIDYSMSVIVARALPEVKDGLKPSQRRVLVAMNDLGLQPPGAHYRKSAKIAGDTSGNYHPHGEAVVYPTMVKMAQDFSSRYPLIDGQGNFGSIDGDPAAAMRYTEARMGKISLALIKDLNKGTVTFVPNYDGTRLEPTVLPTAFPNVLANGSDGIAVGMATKIPPFNLTELCNALQEMIKQGNKWEGKAVYNELRKAKEAKERIPQVLSDRPADYFESYVNTANLDYVKDMDALKEKLKENGEVLYPEFKSDMTPTDLINIIPGPDFPTGGIVYDQQEILNTYATGRGKIIQRAKASIQEAKNGKYEIIVSEIPFQVNKAHMIEKIADLVKEKKVTGITDIVDASNIEGMRVIISLKRDTQPKVVLNKLYKYTEMQKVFNANMIALVDQEPKTLPIKRILELFLSFRLTVTIRRFEYDLANARYRAHILEGLLKAIDMLDEVIATIRASKTQEAAKTNLIEKFDFTEVQAQAILDMQLRKLAALERQKLQDEFKELEENIKYYNEVLSTPEKVLEVINNDIEDIKQKYGDERRTKVIKGKVSQIADEDMIPPEETLVTITHAGYVKRVTPDTYKAQKRGGKGVSGGETKEGDFIEHVFQCNTLDELLLFTNKGKVYNLRIFEIPELSRTAKGLPIVNLVQMEHDEMVTSVLTRDPKGKISQDQEDNTKTYKYTFMATKNGIVKKTEMKEFASMRANGLIAIKLDEGDQLTWVKPTTGDDEIILITQEGKSIRFKETDVRPLGRQARGVTGIKFKSKEDAVIGMEIVKDDNQKLFVLSEKGYGKMSSLKEYATQGRGGTGIFTFKVTGKTGQLAEARILPETASEEELVVISAKTKVIRSKIDTIPTLKRQTSGVKIMDMVDDDRVSAVTLL